MSVVAALQSIRSQWITKVARRLARGEGVRASFRQQLDRFYDMLIHTVETGDSGWLETVIDDWVKARTETELKKHEAILPSILGLISILTFDILRERFSAGDAIEYYMTLLPVFTRLNQYAAQREMDLHMEHLAAELEEVRISLERLDRSKSDFISIAAHELKTPLTLIEGYSAMLEEHDPEEVAMVDVYLRGIANGTRRLREIVNDMVDVSLIDNNLLTLNFQPLWISHILDMIEDHFEPVLEKRRLDFRINKFPGCDTLTFGDEERLFQALRNIVSNAIKYTPDGGAITIDGSLLPGFIEITVADTGIGVAPEDHRRIFEKFGRLGNAALHSSSKTKFKGGGPGLGLPIAKGIIEAHGGAIWVESEGYDEERCPGTTFHILLPFRDEPPDDRFSQLFGEQKRTLEANKIKSG